MSGIWKRCARTSGILNGINPLQERADSAGERGCTCGICGIVSGKAVRALKAGFFDRDGGLQSSYVEICMGRRHEMDGLAFDASIKGWMGASSGWKNALASQSAHIITKASTDHTL